MHITRLPKLLTQAKGAKKTRDGRSMSSVSTLGSNVPKGHLAVYVGDVCNTSRFVIPVAYLNHPLFKGLLRKAEEEFGFEHPMGGLTLPCSEEDFLNLISQLSGF